jgi:hypothetical protein
MWNGFVAFDGPVPSTRGSFLGLLCGLSVAHSGAGRRTIGRAVDLVRTSLGTVHPATSVCGRREHTHTTRTHMAKDRKQCAFAVFGRATVRTS